MKKIFLLLTLITLTSCKEKIDLSKISFDEKIDLEKHISDSENISSLNFDLDSFKSENLEGFSFNGFDFSNFRIENGYPYSVNEIYILVNNFKEKKYLGFTIRLVGDNVENLNNYLKENYKLSENKDSRGNTIAQFAEDNNGWIFLTQNEEKSKDGKTYKQIIFTYVKKGTKIENSENKNGFTLLEYFNFLYPEKQ